MIPALIPIAMAPPPPMTAVNPGSVTWALRFLGAAFACRPAAREASSSSSPARQAS